MLNIVSGPILDTALARDEYFLPSSEHETWAKWELRDLVTIDEHEFTHLCFDGDALYVAGPGGLTKVAVYAQAKIVQDADQSIEAFKRDRPENWERHVQDQTDKRNNAQRNHEFVKNTMNTVRAVRMDDGEVTVWRNIHHTDIRMDFHPLVDGLFTKKANGPISLPSQLPEGSHQPIWGPIALPKQPGHVVEVNDVLPAPAPAPKTNLQWLALGLVAITALALIVYLTGALKPAIHLWQATKSF
jgi:hypothetical protein